jgi:UDPglucose 6-dehydrogenase
MKVCVLGLWHLGSVTAACLARTGHDVVGLDFDAKTIADLSAGQAPLFEPGLDDLVKAGLAAGKLAFSTDPAACKDAAVVWVNYDTPVDDDDNADVQFVVDQVEKVLPHMADGAVLLVSSQLPVGTAKRVEAAIARLSKKIGIAVSPENLRLGKAIDAFEKPERIIVGIRDAWVRDVLTPLLQPISPNIHWIAVESAEMVKHALNAWLAMSVTYANEIAVLCEQTGAHAAEVEAALRAEPRVGQRAYIRPGAAFAGGTLGRDIKFLSTLSKNTGAPAPMLGAIAASNNGHRKWALRALQRLLGSLEGRRIAVLGLSYKPGTDATRRSIGVELARGLKDAGAQVVAFDPKVKTAPFAGLEIAAGIEDALRGADAAVIATNWPEFKDISAAQMQGAMKAPLLLDADRHLGALSNVDGIRYITVGSPA